MKVIETGIKGLKSVGVDVSDLPRGISAAVGNWLWSQDTWKHHGSPTEILPHDESIALFIARKTNE